MRYKQAIDGRQVGGDLHVALRGPFDYSRAGDLLDLMDAHYGDRIERIILDLRCVKALDSTWLWEFETVRSRNHRASISLSMYVQETSRVTSILQRAGFGALFLVSETRTQVCAPCSIEAP